MLTEAELRECEEARTAWQREEKRMREAGYSADKALDDDKGYNAWLRWKKAEQKLISHGAEGASKALYSVYFAIHKVCFEKGLPPVMNLYFMPSDLEARHTDAAGMYGYHVIMINKAYYEQHGIDDAVINTMFHEMCHAFCDVKIQEKKIKDTEGAYHLPAYADVCKEHGGTCAYVDAVSGYSAARLTAESMDKVRAELRRKGIE